MCPLYTFFEESVPVAGRDKCYRDAVVNLNIKVIKLGFEDSELGEKGYMITPYFSDFRSEFARNAAADGQIFDFKWTLQEQSDYNDFKTK